MDISIAKQYNVNGNPNMVVKFYKLKNNFALLKCFVCKTKPNDIVYSLIWEGFGCFDKEEKKYYGIFKYKNNLRDGWLDGVIGFHFGTVINSETIHIFGLNVSKAFGIFNYDLIKTKTVRDMTKQ